MRRLAVFAVLLIAAPAISTAAAPPTGVPSPQSASGEIQELRNELARINAAGPQDTAAAKASLQALNARESALSIRLGQDRNRLARLLSALQLFRSHPPPALLVSPGDARDAVRAAILIRAMTPELERRAAALSGQARAMAALRREAAAANAELFSAESTVAEQRSDIERLLDDEAAGRAPGDGLFARSPGLLITTLPSGPAQTGTLGRLIPPVAGPLVRRYGAPLPSGGRSPGIGFAALPGSVVKAPARGVVEFAGPVAGWGVVVIVRGAGAYHLVLAGLTEATVAPGQSVASGAPVGRMTDEGQSEPELYLEVRENGAAVDPSRWLTATSQRTAIR